MNRKFSHVVAVGIDGAGSFFKDSVTPHFDRIFSEGAVTFNALASDPTISAECWGSMLLGVGPEVHKLNNGIVSSTPYPVDSPFPSLFRRIRDAYPEAELGSFCDWNPITYGIVENNIGVAHDTASDDELTLIICDYVINKKPDFLFIQFDSVDGVGHSKGYGSPEYRKRLTHIDSLINEVYRAYSDTGIIDDTLFIVIADHGGRNPVKGQGGCHGGPTPCEKYVTFAARGKGIMNTRIQKMNIRDLSAIVLYSFGIDAPAFDEKGWTSQIPEGIFDNDNIPLYRDISHLTGAEPRISKVRHTSELRSD